MKKLLSPKVLLSPPLGLVPKQGRLKNAKPVKVDDPHKVVSHAARTGTAVVVDADGNPILVITIPTADLPPLD